MEKPSSSRTELTVPKKYFWILLVLWTVIVGSILLWGLLHQEYEIKEVARIHARDSFEKDIVYRRWATGHGGVYVPMTDKTPPNPDLSHIEERDITTPSGRILTLVNPAYMTRQVHQLGLEQYGSRGHITSLKPLRPANAADEWETKALRAFEQGVKEVSSIEKLDNQNYMRLMRPLITEQGCLKCHADQGYRVGDLRGGISVSVPMAPIQAIARGHALTLAGGLFVLWLLGVGGISLGGQHLKQRTQECKYAEEQTANLARFPSENPNPVLRIDSNGVLLYANNSSESFLVKWDCAVGEIVPENWRQTVSEVFAAGSSKRLKIEHKDRTFAFMLVPILDAGYINLYARDITEREQAVNELKRAYDELDLRVQERSAELMQTNEALTKEIIDRKQSEEKLRKSEEKFRTLIANIPDVTWTSDNEGNTTFISSNIKEIYGYSPEEIYRRGEELRLGRIHPDDVENVRRALGSLFDTTCPQFDIEYRIKKRNGEWIWLHDRSIATYKKGGTTYADGILADITERKQAEELLEDSEARFRMIYEHAPIMIDAFDGNGRCVMWNKKCESTFGWTMEEINAHDKPLSLFYPDPQVRSEVMKTVGAQASRIFQEWHPVTKDGTKLVTLWANFKLPDGTVINLGQDITKHKQAEDEAQKLRNEYTHIARVSMMGELTASLAHELKQPLAAMRTNAQAAQRFLTADKPDIDELHEILKDIIKDNRRADDVIKKLRALMQKSELQITRLNINEAIEDIFPLVHSYEIVRNISLKFEHDKNISYVNGDRIQLQQVVLNLIINSSEALMDVEQKSSSIVVRTNQNDKDNVTVSVTDNGPGIDDTIMSSLFEPFYTTKTEGLGMGLAISRSIIDGHRGRLWAENNDDRGATFCFTIPIAKEN